MSEVKVEVLNHVSGEELENMLNHYLGAGFNIQDSHVRWYQGTIEGVYVFVKYIAVEIEQEGSE